MQLDTAHREGGREMQRGMGGVLNLLAGQIISAIMLFKENSLCLVSIQHFRKNAHLANPLPKCLFMDLTKSIFFLI